VRPRSCSSAPAAGGLRSSRSLDPHKYDFAFRLAVPPMLRSSRFRLQAAGSCSLLWDAPGPRAFHAHQGTLAAVETAESGGPAFPSFARETASTFGRSFAL